MFVIFLFQRYVPFAAVAAANCVNIPLMRQNEILGGIEVCDENGNKVTSSKVILLYDSVNLLSLGSIKFYLV